MPVTYRCIKILDTIRFQQASLEQLTKRSLSVLADKREYADEIMSKTWGGL